MTQFLRGKVAALVSPHSVIINRGTQHGVKVGEYWVIGIEVIDPDDGDYLGTADRVRVRVSEVYPKYCYASTYVTTQLYSPDANVGIRIGDSAERAEKTQRPDGTPDA